MALELFKPFIYNKLENALVTTIKSAKKLVEKERPRFWDILRRSHQGAPNFPEPCADAAPSGYSAFEPLLIEGKAIQLHPLSVRAFNADLTATRWAVHVRCRWKRDGSRVL